MTTPSIPDVFGLSVAHLLAGGLGGLVRGLTRPEQSWIRRSAGAIAGAFLAGYVTPVAAPIAASYLSRWNVPPEAVAGVCGFLSGPHRPLSREGAIRLAERWRAETREIFGRFRLEEARVTYTTGAGAAKRGMGELIVTSS